jgi:multidrug efflux pump subunit AcrA (membrane-fusion protein)
MNRLLTTGAVLAVAGLPLSACKEVETETATGYTPSKVQELKEGSKAFPRVTFTSEGAKRTGLESTRVRSDGGRTVVPYKSLIYDAQGKTFVYTSPKPLHFLRAEVKVDRIEGSRVLLTRGPSAGTTVVTTGTAEVYGAELDIAGSH